MNQIIVMGKVLSVINLSENEILVSLSTKTTNNEETVVKFTVDTEGKYNKQKLGEEIMLATLLAVKLEFILPTEQNKNTIFIASKLSVLQSKGEEVKN
jgi:hypothetical protein